MDPAAAAARGAGEPAADRAPAAAARGAAGTDANRRSSFTNRASRYDH